MTWFPRIPTPVSVEYITESWAKGGGSVDLCCRVGTGGSLAHLWTSKLVTNGQPLRLPTLTRHLGAGERASLSWTGSRASGGGGWQYGTRKTPA